MEDAYIPNESKIHCGDTVRVDFNNSQYTLCSSATVLFMPSCAGDCWGFKDNKTGDIHYVSEGCTVTKILTQNESRKTKNSDF